MAGRLSVLAVTVGAAALGVAAFVAIDLARPQEAPPQPPVEARNDAVVSAAAGAAVADPDPACTEPVADAVNSFGVELYLQIARGGPQDLVAISPVGMALALGALGQGATGEAETALAAIVGCNSAAAALPVLQNLSTGLAAQAEGVVLRQGVSAWSSVDQAFTTSFLERLAAIGATTGQLDFATPAAVEEINQWVATATEGMIGELVEQLPPTTDFLLTNAVYLAADWERPFDPALTQEGVFAAAAGEQPAQFMRHPAFRVPYERTDLYERIVLPYAGQQYAMVLLLPTNQPLASFLEATDGPTLRRALTDEPAATALGEIVLPRFELSFGGNVIEQTGLAPVLANPAFLNDVVAGGTVVTEILHRARINVDEEGTTAAAATAIVGTRSLLETEFRFRADRPFLLSIVDRRSGVILFVGQVVRP